MYFSLVLHAYFNYHSNNSYDEFYFYNYYFVKIYIVAMKWAKSVLYLPIPLTI